MVPLVIHGDDADSHRRRSFCVLTLSSATCRGCPFDTKYLLYCVDNSHACTETWDVLDTWLTWSLVECQMGQFMTVDPWQRPIDRPAGRVAGRYTGVLVSLKGDEKWLQRVLKLKNSWVSEHVCPICRASKRGVNTYSTFCPGAKHRATMLTNEEFVTETAQNPPWVRLPGFHVQMLHFDWLHVVDLSITPECCASVQALVSCAVCFLSFQCTSP